MAALLRDAATTGKKKHTTMKGLLRALKRMRRAGGMPGGGQGLLSLLVMMVALFCFCVLLETVAMGATTVYQPNIFKAATGVPAAVAASSTNAVTSAAIPVPQGKGIAFWPAAKGTNAATALVTYKFELTYDGTNYTTTTPLQVGVSLTGTTAALGFTNVPPTFLTGVRAIKLTSVVNAHTSGIEPLGVVYSYSNQ